MGGFEESPPEELYGRISLRRLARMLRKFARRRATGGWRLLGKVWMSVPSRGLLTAHQIKLAILEIEAPPTGSTTWVIRGLVCDASSPSWRLWSYGNALEISYDPESRVGTENYWREPFPPGVTVGEMQNLTARLVG